MALYQLIPDAFTIYSQAYAKIGELSIKAIDVGDSPEQPVVENQIIQVSSLFYVINNLIILNDDGTAIVGLNADAALINSLFVDLKEAADINPLTLFPSPLNILQFNGNSGNSTLPVGPLGALLESDGTKYIVFPMGADGTVLTSSPSGLVWSSVVGNGIPSGGSTNQYLRKNSNTSYDVVWDTLTLNKITNVTSTATEVNKLSGATWSTAESNTLVGINTGVSIQSQINGKLSTTLANGKFLVGNGSNVATAVTPTGDVVFDNAGVFAISSGVIINSDINAAAGITRSKLAVGTSDRLVINSNSGVMTDAAAITANRLLISDSFGIPTHSTISSSIVPFIDPTSSIQTQLNSRLQVVLTSPAQGDLIQYNGTNWVNFPLGTSGQVITSNGTSAVWGAAAANGLPTGGTTNQYLRKIDATNYNTQWHTFVLSDVTDVTTTNTELNLLSGLTTGSSFINLTSGGTSNFQGQIDLKLGQNLANHAIWIGGGSNTAVQTSPGTNGSVLTIVAGHPTWQTPPPPGTFSGPLSSTDNAIVRFNGTDGTSGQNSGIIIDDSDNISGVTNLLIKTGGAIRTNTSAGNTLLFQAYDVDGTAYTTFATLTANNTPTFDLDTSVTIGSAYIYRAGGTKVAVSDGGTNIASYTIGDILYASASGVLSKLAAGTNTYVLTSNGPGTAPSWQVPGGGGGGTGDVVGPGSATDNAITRFDTTTGKLIQNSVGILSDTGDLSGIANLTLNTGGGLRTGTSNTNTALLQAYNTGGSSYTTFGTLTAGASPTFDLASGVTIGGAAIYRVGGTDVALGDGGTGASLSAPGADRIFFYDFSGTSSAFLTPGSTLAITTTTIDVATNGIGNSQIRQSAALSIIGNATNALANVDDISTTADGDVLRRSGTTLGFGTIGDISITDLAWSKITGAPVVVSSITIASSNGFAGSSSGGTTPTLTISTSITGIIKGNGTAISAATSGIDYSAGTSGLTTGILKSTTTTGALTIAVAGDFPILNQNTTGNAATVTTNANLTGDVTSVGNATTYNGTVPVTKGGTNVTSLTAYAPIFGGTTSTGSVQSGTVGTSGQVLTSNGAGALPTFQTPISGFTNPMTTLGDIIYEDATPDAARLAGNTTATKKFLTQTGTGTISAVPGWNTISAGDVPTLNQNTTGSAATLTTPRTINGVSFDGSANITVTAAAGTLTGTTLNSTVVTSSLTSVGTIGTGVWQGTAIADAYISSAATWNAKVSSQWVTTGSDIYYSTGNVMIGTNAAPSTTLHVVGTSTATPRGVLVDQYNSGTQGARITMRKARGTFASPTTIVTGDALASWTASGYDGTNFLEAGKILVTSIGTIGTGTVPATMVFQTANASGTLTTGITIDQSQIVTLANALPLASGGTNASLTASNGGVFYSTASAGAILAGTATANKVLMSGASGAPSWSTPTFPNASATLNTSIISDGTNWIASTVTRPNSAATGDLLYASGTNVYANLADVATGNALISGGVTTAPSWGKITSSHVDATILSNPMTSVGDMIQGTTAGAPARLASVAVGSVLLSGGVTTANAWGAVSNGLTATASTFKWGGAITAATSITGAFALDFTQAINSAFTVAGTWTATANNQFHQNFTGTLTGRGTVSDNLTYSLINPTMVVAANGQNMVAVDINPTFTNGAFTNPVNLALRVQTGSFLLGATSSSVAKNVYRAEIYGFGTSTTTATLAVFNSGSSLLLATQDDGQVVLSNAGGGNSPRIAAQNNGTRSITGQGLELIGHFSGSATNRVGIHFSANGVAESATTTTSMVLADPTFSPSAGANNLQVYRAAPVINQTSTATGSFAGFVYDPVLNTPLGLSYAFISSGGRSGFGTLTPTAQVHALQGVLTSLWVPALQIDPGAHTGMTASTEFPNIIFSTVTQQFATGTLATQRNMWIKAPTWGFVGASTLTSAYNLYVDSPIAGTNATITNNFALGLAGNLSLVNAGNKIFIKTGSNASMGTGTLVGGTATITTTACTTSSVILLGDTNTSVTNVGTLTYVRSSGSFVVTSTNVLDTSTFVWIIFEPAP